MTRRLAPLLAALAAGLAASAGSAAPRRLAVVVGKPLGSMQQAVAGIRDLPRVEVETFELFRGTGETDRAAAALRRGGFDGVVALGGSAHAFAAPDGPRAGGYAATLVMPEDDREAGDALVPFDARPADWARLLRRLGLTRRAVGAFASGPKEAARLAPLARALAADGGRLEIVPVEDPKSLTAALRDLLGRVDALFFARDRALLAPVVALEILRTAHHRRVPVLAYSRGLVRVGAVLSLDYSCRTAGVRAARAALGMPPVPGEARPRLTVNDARAESLGLAIPDAVRREWPAPAE